MLPKRRHPPRRPQARRGVRGACGASFPSRSQRLRRTLLPPCGGEGGGDGGGGFLPLSWLRCYGREKRVVLGVGDFFRVEGYGFYSNFLEVIVEILY